MMEYFPAVSRLMDMRLRFSFFTRVLIVLSLGGAFCSCSKVFSDTTNLNFKDANGKTISPYDYAQGHVLIPTQPAPAPDWQLKDLSGKSVKLSDFKGKVVVLNFWATWCPPCQAEIPDFIALQNKFQGKDVAIVGISLDSLQPTEVAAFVKKQGINYPVVMSSDDASAAYGADIGLPITYLIDGQGRIVGVNPSLINAGAFEKRINELLAR